MTEREAIVSWLRELPSAKAETLSQRERNSRAYVDLIATVNMLANAIERGDYIKETDNAQ